MLEPHSVLSTTLIRGIPDQDTLNKATEGFNKVVIFGDFNNMCKGMYYQESVESIVRSMIDNKGSIPQTLVTEWIRVQNYFEVWAKMNNKRLSCIYFCEAGESYYHKNLFKDYKKNRTHGICSMPDDLLSYFNNNLDSIRDAVRSFLLSSWKWICAISKSVNIGTVRLENLDADFIPEYFLRKSGNYDEETCYLILSTDGDMIQTLDYADNIRIVDNSMITTDQNWLTSKKYLILDENKDMKLTPDRIILYKAVVGDSSDAIPGIKGIGGKGFFKDFVTHISEKVRCDDLIEMKKELTRISSNKVAKKILDNWDLYCTLTKLVSFRLLIENLYNIPSRAESMSSLMEENKLTMIQESCLLQHLNKNINSNQNL